MAPTDAIGAKSAADWSSAAQGGYGDLFLWHAMAGDRTAVRDPFSTLYGLFARWTELGLWRRLLRTATDRSRHDLVRGTDAPELRGVPVGQNRSAVVIRDPRHNQPTSPRSAIHVGENMGAGLQPTLSQFVNRRLTASDRYGPRGSRPRPWGLPLHPFRARPGTSRPSGEGQIRSTTPASLLAATT
jgi:hypothetical protein